MPLLRKQHARVISFSCGVERGMQWIARAGSILSIGGGEEEKDREH